MDLVTQVVTIVAVVVGGLTTYVTNQLMEHGRQRMELQTRWDGRKLDAYAEYVGRARASIYSAVLLYEVREGIRTSARDLTSLEQDHTNDGVVQALAFERIMLLAGQGVIDAAHAVQEATAAVSWQARGLVAGTLDEWRTRNQATFEAINLFHSRARTDLGVSGMFRSDDHSGRGLLLPDVRGVQVARDDVTD